MNKQAKKAIIFSLLAAFFSLSGLVSSCQNKQVNTQTADYPVTREARKDEVIVKKIETTHFYQYSFTTIRDITWLDTYVTSNLGIDPDRIISIYMVYNKDKGWNSYRVVVRK